MRAARLNIYVERNHARRLAELAATRGISKSSIIAAALASFLSPDSADRREAAIGRRLDQLTRQFDKLDRDQNILIETIALFIHYYLSVALTVPEAHEEAVKAQGRARFDQFVQQLARHLQRGNSLVREVYEEVFPDDSRFFGHAAESVPAATESAS
jgi:hypothetical protein